MSTIDRATPTTWWGTPWLAPAIPRLTRYPTTVRPRHSSSDAGTLTKGSISRRIPTRSITRSRNQGIRTAFSTMVRAAVTKR